MLRKCRKVTILIFILVNLIFIPQISNLDQESSDSSNKLNINGSEIIITTPENKTYTEPMSGYYPATYGFENDYIGGDALEWDDSASDASCGSLVLAEKNGHYNVIEIYDNNGGSKARLNNDFMDQAYGTAEFWFLPEDATNGDVIRLMDFDLIEDRAFLRLKNEHWYTYDGVIDTLIPNVPDPQDNVWQHVRIDFESTSGGYHGLSQYTYEVTIDGIKSGQIPFYTNGGSIDRFNIFTGNTATTTRWIDAIGYSWDSGYAIGDNLNEGLLLSFGTSFSPDWQGYSLDGAVNKTILGNTTINLPFDGIHTIQVFGNNSIGEMFESDIRHFSVEYISIDLITPENIIYTDPMSGYYPGTYGFENESVGTIGLDIDFLDTYEASTNCYTTIVSELGTHKNVLQLYDNNIGLGLRTQFFNYFGNKGSGTIEFWIRTTDATLASHVRVYSSTEDYIIQFKIEDDRIQTNDENTFVDLVNPAKNNQWYHIRFDLESTTGGYQGLSQYEYYVSVDGIRYGSFGFQYDVIPYKLFIGTLGIDGGYSAYYDAIGYSWDPHYDIGDNLEEGLLLSYTNSSVLEWIGYVLDGQVNITIRGNKVIPMPGNGLHSLQIYGRSILGYYYESNLVYFTVDISLEPPLNGDNFILIFILIGVFSLVGVTIAIIVIKKVHIPTKEPKPRKPKVKKLKPKKKGIIAADLFCPFCQNPITPEHKFCTFCGSNLNKEEEI